MTPAYRTVEYARVYPDKGRSTTMYWVEGVYEGQTYCGAGLSIQKALWDMIRVIEHERPDGPPIWLLRAVETP
jgi:hypothetical protein